MQRQGRAGPWSWGLSCADSAKWQQVTWSCSQPESTYRAPHGTCHGQHCSASHFLHIKKLLQGPAFCGSEHVLLETALYYVTKVQFNKNKTLSFQCAHTTQIRGDQAPPSLFRWMLESSTKHWLLGTPASTWQLQHQPPPPEVKSFSCQKKNTYMGGKKELKKCQGHL